MDSAIRIAIIVIIIGIMIGLVATVGIPSLPAGTDELIDTFCGYLQDGRKILNYVVNPYIINGALVCVIVIKNIDHIIKLYGYIRRWFAGG